MENNTPIAIIGGYDLISKSFFSEINNLNSQSIFVNLNNVKVKNDRVYNLEIYQLKKIFEILEKHKVERILFLGKINRPDLRNFKKDGEIDKYIPILFDSFKKGDGTILSLVLDIFIQKGYKILPPDKVSSSFFFDKKEIFLNVPSEDIIDVKKSVKLLNELSKYDNAQSIVSVNGYIIAIEAAEGTDKLLHRAYTVRKDLGHLKNKAGLLVKIPKKNQNKLIDLPVVGIKTIKLVKKANLKGIAINPRLTIIHEKIKLLRFVNENGLRIYNAV